MDKFDMDWYDKLKIDIIDLVFSFQNLKKEIIFMIITNNWIFEDINLFENFIHLKEMVDISDINLSNLVKLIYELDNNSNFFSKLDLLDEFEYIKENIHLESNYINNMTDYMILINDFSVNGDEITEKLENYCNNDNLYYNQMKINNQNLKQLKKERIDYFE